MKKRQRKVCIKRKKANNNSQIDNFFIRDVYCTESASYTHCRLTLKDTLAASETVVNSYKAQATD